MLTEEQRINFLNAGNLIVAGKISNLDQLYKIVSKKAVGICIEVNPVRFSNFRANDPGSFKLIEIVKIAGSLKVKPEQITTLLINSLY